MKDKPLAKHKLTWDEIESDLTLLERKLEPIVPLIKSIYGAPRGGLILAIMLSHRMDLPVLLDSSKINRNTLVLDDICDTGSTLKKIMKNRKVAATATLWYHPDAKIVPDYFVKTKAGTWLVFPWETMRSSRIDNTLSLTEK